MSIKEKAKPRRIRRRKRGLYIRKCIICTLIAFFVGIAIGYMYGLIVGSKDEPEEIPAQKDLETGRLQLVDDNLSSRQPNVPVINPSIADAKGMHWGYERESIQARKCLFLDD